MVVEGFGDRRHLLRERFGRLLAEAPAWRSVMASLPTTLAHLDCWANNLVVPSSGDPVLVDWAFCGLGAVGEDPGNLVPDGFLDHCLDPGRYAEVDAAVWGAYADGLAVARWPWPPEMARLGMCLAVLKFVWVPALMVANAGYAGPTGYGGRAGPELVEVFRRRAVVFEAMLERVEEARALAAALDAHRRVVRPLAVLVSLGAKRVPAGDATEQGANAMRRRMFLGKIHRATVTQADLDYEGSVTIDADLLDAAGILVHEEVQIWNVSNGNRLATYALEGPRGSGVVCINGAAAHLVDPGDLVILASFGELDDAEARVHEPKVVFVDCQNRITGTGAERPGPMLPRHLDDPALVN